MSRKIGVLLSYVLMIFEVLSTLLLTPYLIGTLGQAEYGVYKLSFSVNAYLMLLDLGVGNAITRYLAKYRAEQDKENEQKFMGIASVFYFGIAVIAIIVGVVLALIFPNVFAEGLSMEEARLGQKLLSITMINSAVTLGTTAFTNAIVAYERFWISKGSQIIQIILRVLFSFLALRNGMGSVGIVVVNLILTIVCRAFFVLYVLFGIKIYPKLKGIEWRYVKEIVSYSSMILLQMIATQLNNTVDQVLIGALVPSSAIILAVYGIGVQVVQYFQSMGSAFNGVMMPGIVRLVQKEKTTEAITNEMIRIGRIIFMILGLVWVGFLFSGQSFINLWAGEENHEAFFVTVILMTAQLFIITETVGLQVLWALNEHRELAILKIVIVAMNVVLTIYLIKWNPLIGATVGTFISLVLGDIIVMNVIFAKKFKMNILNYYRRLFKGIVPCIVLTGVIGFALNLLPISGWIGLLIKIIAMSAFYILLLFGFGMNYYEKGLIKAIILKMVKKAN